MKGITPNVCHTGRNGYSRQASTFSKGVFPNTSDSRDNHISPGSSPWICHQSRLGLIVKHPRDTDVLAVPALNINVTQIRAAGKCRITNRCDTGGNGQRSQALAIVERLSTDVCYAGGKRGLPQGSTPGKSPIPNVSHAGRNRDTRQVLATKKRLPPKTRHARRYHD